MSSIENESYEKPEKRVRKWNRYRKLDRVWTIKEESQLIGAVQKRHALWDFGCVEYKLASLKRDLWEDIATEMKREGIDAREAKVKWNNLRSNFKATLAKYRARYSDNDGSNMKKVGWPHFAEMMFLETTSSESTSSLISAYSKDSAQAAVMTQRERQLSKLWTVEEESELIEAVKRKPTVWDSSCLEYKFSKIKNDCWQDIAAELKHEGIDAHQAKLKWNFLRNNFKMTLAKFRARIGDQTPGDIKSVGWIHFAKMLFLEPVEAEPSIASAHVFTAHSFVNDVQNRNLTSPVSDLQDNDQRTFESTLPTRVAQNNQDEFRLQDNSSIDISRDLSEETDDSKQIGRTSKQYWNRNRKLAKSWSKTEESKLIKSVEKRAALWHSGCPGYKLPNIKRELWEEIAEELQLEGIDGQQAKLKWNNLRSNFKATLVKFRARYPHKNPTDANSVRWPHFIEMTFLETAVLEESMDPSTSSFSENTIADHHMDLKHATAVNTPDPPLRNILHRKCKLESLSPMSSSEKNTKESVDQSQDDVEQNADKPNAHRTRKLVKGWTTNKESQLIEAVRKRSALWDSDSAEYKHTHLKNNYWEEIATEIQQEGIDAQQAKMKWNSLRSNFKAALAKFRIRHNGKIPTDVTCIGWTHFAEMMFLESTELDQSIESSFSVISENSVAGKFVCSELNESMGIISPDQTTQNTSQHRKRKLEPLTSIGSSQDTSKRLAVQDSMRHSLLNDTNLSTDESQQSVVRGTLSQNRHGKLAKVWTTSKESQLIEAVQKRNPLWDWNCPAYTLANVKNECWEEIATELNQVGIDAHQARLKWNSLRSNFKAVLAKFRAGKSSNEARGNATLGWPHFTEMMFLEFAEEEHSMESTSALHSENSNSHQSFANNSNESADITSPVPEQQYIYQPHNCLLESTRTRTSTRNSIKELPAKVQPNIPINQEDRFSAFGKLISGHLRELPPHLAAKLESEIARTLYNFLAFNTPANEPSSMASPQISTWENVEIKQDPLDTS